jgi:hypothetical protein
MPFIVHGAKRILFVHIPRTGGTAIEQWLQRFGDLKLFSYSLPNFSRVTPQHLRMTDIHELFGNDYFDYQFTIVRNPFDRIASEFRLRCEIARRGAWQGEPLFSTWLERNLDEQRRAPFHLDNHLRPQWEFVSSTLDVLKYEDGLAQAAEHVWSRMGLRAAEPPDHLVNRPPRADGVSDVSFDVADVERVLAHYSGDFSRFGYSKTPP